MIPLFYFIHHSSEVYSIPVAEEFYRTFESRPQQGILQKELGALFLKAGVFFKKEVYSEHNQTSKMEFFAKIVTFSHYAFTIFANSSILDICLGSEQASEKLF